MSDSGALTFRGFEQLSVLRVYLRQWMTEQGIVIIFSPDTEPDLRDYLLVGAHHAVVGGAVGAAVGALLASLLTPDSTSGTNAMAAGAVGGVIGAIGGAWYGAQKVRMGWRIRAVMDGEEPLVEMRMEAITGREYQQASRP